MAGTAKCDDIDTLLQEAGACLQDGRLDEAQRISRLVLSSHPESSLALNIMGTAQLRLGDLSNAVRSLLESLSLDSNQISARSNLGYAYFLQKNLESALEQFNIAIRSDPIFVSAYNNRGLAYLALNQIDRAQSDFETALGLRPNYAEVHNNFGNLYLQTDQINLAINSYRQAIYFNPGFIDARMNLSKALTSLNLIDESLSCLAEILGLKPNYPVAMWAVGLNQLLKGNYVEGWKHYEWRWLSPTFGHNPRNFPRPLWTRDSSITDQTILIHAEQGFGDTIQFCRYIPMLAALGANVMLIAQPELRGLILSSNLKCRFFEPGEKLPPFNFHCALMSLPAAFRTSLDHVPNHVPYLFADPQKRAFWRARVGEGLKLKVGIAWAGRAAHLNDRNRSMRLDQIMPLLDSDVEFHCLHKEIRLEAIGQDMASGQIQFHGLMLKDFSDTAALISEMDLIISADTAVAHLAGALGKSVWILLPFAPDFRWMLKRSDSPWYPNARLFRQSQVGDWSKVVETIQRELEQFSGLHSNGVVSQSKST